MKRVLARERVREVREAARRERKSRREGVWWMRLAIGTRKRLEERRRVTVRGRGWRSRGRVTIALKLKSTRVREGRAVNQTGTSRMRLARRLMVEMATIELRGGGISVRRLRSAERDLMAVSRVKVGGRLGRKLKSRVRVVRFDKLARPKGRVRRRLRARSSAVSA